jgi:hypothetical protein
VGCIDIRRAFSGSITIPNNKFFQDTLFICRLLNGGLRSLAHPFLKFTNDIFGQDVR